MIGSIRRLAGNFRIVGGLQLRKPRLIRRLLSGYMSAFLKGNTIGSLRFMDIALSYTCNFRCQHCSALALDRGKEGEELTLEDYRRVAAQAMELGVCAFHFTGGEPLLRKDIFDVIRAFHPQENLISIQTNGWHVDERFLDAFREAGGDILCVSVDSATPGDHDAFRSRDGSWRRAVAALDLARRNGFQTLMSSTVTHWNLGNEDLSQLIELSREMRAILSLNLAVPAGEWRGHSDLLLDAEDRRKLDLILKKHPHVRTDFESNWTIRGCPAFKEKCYLSPYGDVLPCPFIQVSFGNVRADSLERIREGALGHPYLQKYHPICIAAEDKQFISCAGCYNAGAASLPINHRDSPLFGSSSPSSSSTPAA
jgi:MoaA/NifB/PqqE/SkfB family radical SAM enzyme